MNNTYTQRIDLDELSPKQIKELETRNKLEQQLLLLEELKNRQKLSIIKNDYLEYLKETNINFKVGKHIEYLTIKMQEFMNQNDKKYLMISMPPQHGKSMAITEAFPSWYLLNNMDDRVIIASYNERFAAKFGKKNRNKLKECSKLFDFELDGESVLEFGIAEHTGMCISRGIMSGITGNPADLIIIDDPIKNRKEAESKNKRDTLYAEFLDTLNTRLSAKGKMIIILTRWHQDDLIGKIQKEFPKLCEVVNITCEAEENDILGRKKGDALFPEIGKDNKWLASFKKIYAGKNGSRSWNSLYQGKPIIDGGNYIKRVWLKYYNNKTIPQKLDLLVMSVDATFKDLENNDDVSIQVWGKYKANAYLIDKVTGKMDFIKTTNMIQILKNKYPSITHIYIEDKANGPAIISVLKKKISGIIPIKVSDSKLSRLLAVSGLFEAGNIYLPGQANWLEDYITQLTNFPSVEHDDDVDSTTQALNNIMFKITHFEDTNNNIQDPYKFNGQIKFKNNNDLFCDIDDSFIDFN